MVGDRVDRLAKGRQVVGCPSRLLDVVEADHAEVGRYAEAELAPRGVHEAAGEQVGDAEGGIGPRRPAEQDPPRLEARRIAGRAGADHRSPRSPSVLRGRGEGALARDEARRARRRGDDRDAAASAAVEHVQRLASGAGIVDRNVDRPVEVIVPVDQDHALAAVDAGGDQRRRRRAREHDRRARPVVERLAQRRLDSAALAGGVDDHRHPVDAPEDVGSARRASAPDRAWRSRRRSGRRCRSVPGSGCAPGG